MKKVLLFYGSYGGGHLSAAKSLKEYIEKNYPNCETKLVDCMEYINKTVNKITTSAYSYMAKRAPVAWRKMYKSSEKGFFSKVSNIANAQMATKLNKCIQEFQPSLIISTHPFSSQMCAILKSKGKISCRVGTVLTDFHIHNQWLIKHEFMDYYFVSNNQMKEDMRAKGINSNKIFVTGIPFSDRFLKNFDKLSVCNEFGLNPDRLTALFFAGGELGLGKTRTLAIFECLLKNFPQVQVIAVAGRNEKMKLLFSNCVKKYNRDNDVVVLDYTKKVPELMSISDFVITKPGGLTTTESLISSLPMIIINPIPGQEEQNAEFLENAGVGIWLRKDDDVDQVLEKFLSSPKKLEEMKINAMKLAKPNSIKEIIETLFEEK